MFTLCKRLLLNLALAALVPMFLNGGFGTKRLRKHASFYPLCGITIALLLIFSAGPLSFTVTSPATLSVTKAPKLFNSTYVINKAIGELEADGWIAPKGGALFERLKKMHVASPPRTVSSFVNQTNTEPVLLNADRWKVNYMGCFHSNPKLLTGRKLKLRVAPMMECISYCERNGLPYVAVSAGETCDCGASMSRTLVYKIANKHEFCNMTCKHESHGRLCGGRNFTSIYKIAIHKQEMLTLLDVNKTSYGCFVKPANIEQVFLKKRVIAFGTAAHCLVYCEEILEPIASWDPQSEECMCGKFDGRLSMHGLERSINESMCDGKYCRNMNDCNVRYMVFMRTYAEDNRCTSRSFLTPSNGSVTALISLPGSGNTWARHLIESAVGIYTGSIYNSQILYQQGFFGELLLPNSTRTAVVKTHEGSRKSVTKYQAAVLLIRSPYDAAVAEYNRALGGKLGYAKAGYFKIKEWDLFVYRQLSTWLQTITNFSEMKRIHVTYYESMKANPIKEVKAIIRFLGIPISNLEDRLHCLISDVEGSFKRKKRNLGFDPFTKSLKENGDLFIKSARDILEKRQLPTLPDYERADL